MDSTTLNFKANFKFSQFFWRGTPVPLRVCASKPLSISSVCKKFQGAAPPKGRVIVSRKKSPLECTCIRGNNFFVYGPKFTGFFSSNVGGVVVDQLLFRFSACGSVSEIFAIKVESCQKSRKFLDGFLPSQMLGGRPTKNCTQVITPDSRHVVWIKICDDIPIRFRTY